jgi:RNA polymerase sigma-70 factor (ECF subfamily)
MSDKNLPDELGQRFQEGEAGANAEIANKYKGEMYKFAFTLIADTAASETLVDDVFAKLFTMHKEFDNEINIKSFLYTTTRKWCFSYLKQQRRQQSN